MMCPKNKTIRFRKKLNFVALKKNIHYAFLLFRYLDSFTNMIFFSLNLCPFFKSFLQICGFFLSWKDLLELLMPRLQKQWKQIEAKKVNEFLVRNRNPSDISQQLLKIKYYGNIFRSILPLLTFLYYSGYLGKWKI